MTYTVRQQQPENGIWMVCVGYSLNRRAMNLRCVKLIFRLPLGMLLRRNPKHRQPENG
ncbi:hypothetical protein [Kingella sp. (in: b-proteobacteria)]|uniref:hypothetical protein n=1 Tax=Kingella sp. (in: b-proteobacteria) TaxID=2020713 RepID=UPI0026DB2495|nr:hypothetical protein [Kingella sp. (in: b-proteobacteria)]MDO4658160.1 hypothetical protein [Kingella sp. (in: b-proteobacteria)]